MKRQLEKQQVEIERLEAQLERLKMDGEKQDALNGLAGAKGKQGKSGRSSTRSSVEEPSAEHVEHEATGGAAALGGAVPKLAMPTVKGGSAKAQKVDLRKVMDDFKRPLDDTHTLLDDFQNGHHVPIVLAIAQVEAMQASLRAQQVAALALSARAEALKARAPPQGSTAPAKQRQKRHKDAMEALKLEQRRLENECATLSDTFSSYRDAVLGRTHSELAKALDGVHKASEDLVKSKSEADALKKLEGLCTPYGAAALDEREEERPRQPADLGLGTQLRTLLFLTERASAALVQGGPLDRLARELAGQAGSGCTVEMGSCKGFRRALQKAHDDYNGDYLQLNDMARCLIVRAIAHACGC